MKKDNEDYVNRLNDEQSPMIPEPTEAYLKSLEPGQADMDFRIPFPIPRPFPFPYITGSRVLIWKQDPSVRNIGARQSFLPGLVLNGPRDARVTTKLPGTTPVSRNSFGDFIFRSGTPEMDCSHTFAVVRQTLTMYERALGGTRIPWAWNRGGNTAGIDVYPRAGVTPNAYYSRSQKALKFFYFTPRGSRTQVFTCRSLDIVAHEAGHAILDGLKPGWLGAGNRPQTGGLHESFGDLTSIFLALSQLDQAEALIAITKANLHAKNFLAAVAEQFGSALGRRSGLRNADNNLKLSQVSREVHDISKVFTGAIYDVLADIFSFEKNRQRKTKDPAQVLVEVSHNVCSLVLKALMAAPAVGATYANVANKMLSLSSSRRDPAIYRTFIRNRFTYRQIVVSARPLTAMAEGKIDLDNPDFTDGEDDLELKEADHPSLHGSQDRTGCCGTMQSPEFTIGAQEKLEKGECIEEEELLNEEINELKKCFK